jgi:hypothetical protein
LELPIENSTRLVLTIFPELAYDRYSIHYIKTSSPYLNIKTWDSEADNEKFRLGIYNLGFLSIREKRIELATDEANQLDKLISASLKVEELDGFILDGVAYTLKVLSGSEERIFEWKDKKQLNNNLATLFDKLCVLANL